MSPPLYYSSFNALNEANGAVFWATLTASFLFLASYCWRSVGFLLLVTVGATLVAAAAALAHKHLLNQRRPPHPGAAVLVTGTSTGIGAVIAKEFASLGFAVFATTRKQADFDALKASAPANDRERLLPVILDVADEASVTAAAETVDAEMKARGLHLQSVVNNAGFSQFTTMEASDADYMSRVFRTNTLGPVSVARAFLPLLRASRAASSVPPSLIFVSSALGRLSLPANGAYCATKHALEAIADAFRVELAPLGVSVVVVQPGGVASAFQATATEQKYAAKIPGEPQVSKLYTEIVTRFSAALGDSSKLAPPSVPADAVVEAATVPRPHARYRSTLDSHVVVAIKLLFPEPLVDWLLGRFYTRGALEQGLDSGDKVAKKAE